jgi:TPP-dependent pyruvate/acetoin dehydrogenase alpha subunit
MVKNDSFYRSMIRIRKFEETVLDNFPKGVFFGTTHAYIGQEANAVGVLEHLEPGDIVVSNHRCHGHFLAYGGQARPLFAELMGKASGVCGGRGGSQHLQWANFYSNGIQGGIAPLAVGMALAEKMKNSGVVAVVFLGDGTFGEGVVYEAFNLASLWNAPLLFVVENNHIAQTTPVELALVGGIADRLRAFDIQVGEIDTSDVLEVSAQAEKKLRDVRKFQKPQALVIHTCRFSPHSKGDDTRSTQEIERMRSERDPIKIHGARIEEPVRRLIESEIVDEINSAFQQAMADPLPAATSRTQ